MKMGWPVLVGLSTVLATGCTRPARLAVELQTVDAATVRLGVPMAGDTRELLSQYAPLIQVLERGLGREVELVTAPSYRSVGWLLEQGKIDLAWFSGVAFERVSRTYPAQALARVVRRGRTSYVAELIVRSDPAIESVEDLRGRRLAYVDPESGSGYVAPNQILLDAGVSPGGDLAGTRFTYSHRMSLEGLVQGRFDAAAVFEGALDLHHPDLRTGSLRVLARSRPLPNDVVACSPRADKQFRDRVQGLLLGMAGTIEGRRGLRSMSTYGGLDGFTHP